MARKPPPPAKAGRSGDTTGSPPSSSENGLKAALDQAIGPIVPQQQRVEIVQRVHTVLAQENFSGPMPHPRHLREYESILSGSAERILTMAEQSLQANREMDRLVVQGAIDDGKRGMRFGLAAFFGALVGAAIMGAMGQREVAIAFLAATVIGAVTIFVKGRMGQ